MVTEDPSSEGPVLDVGFVAASTQITAGLAFVLSQVAMVMLSLTRRRQRGRRSRLGLLAGVVCGLTTGGVVLMGLLLFFVPQPWAIAARSVPVAGVVSGLCAYRARPVSSEVLLRQRTAVSATTAGGAEGAVPGDDR